MKPLPLEEVPLDSYGIPRPPRAPDAVLVGPLERYHRLLRLRKAAKTFSSLCTRGEPASAAHAAMQAAFASALAGGCYIHEVYEVQTEGLALGEKEEE
jgi:hypothetical protein